MTDYKPGQIAKATVRGVPDVIVMRFGPKNSGWFTPEYAGDDQGNEPQWRIHYDRDVTDVHPLVVLDPTDSTVKRFLALYQGVNPAGAYASEFALARLIEAQTRPAIEEPGLWGVVEATVNGQRVRMFHGDPDDAGNDWHNHDGYHRVWSDLIDPVLIRGGVEP